MSTWIEEQPACLSIIDKILSSELFKPILTSVTVSNKEDKGGKALNLDTIKQHILDGTISNHFQFNREMEKYFRNLHKLYKKDSTICIILQELVNRYNKMNNQINYLTKVGWHKRCLHLRHRIDNLLKSSPRIIQQYMPYPPPLEVNIRPLTQNEADFIIRMMEKVKRPIDFYTITRIIETDSEELDVEHDDHLNIDLRTLKPKTLCTLYDYFKRLFPSDVPRDGKFTIPIPSRRIIPT